MATLNFNANDVDPNVGFEPIPAGKYLVVISSSQMKPTKNGKGEYLELEFEVLEGPYKGRKIWDRLTLVHPNEQTVQIARGTLSAICHAVNVMAPKDSIELHNLPLVASVGIKKREDNGEPTNVIKGYSKREAGGSVTSSATESVNESTPPWKR